MSEIVELVKASVIYECLSGKVLGIKDVSLKVKEGESVLIMGPSGAGKSTLLGAIYGTIPLTLGEVKIFGKDLNKLRVKELFELRLKKMGYQFQERNMIPAFSVIENIVLLQKYAGVPIEEAAKKARSLLRMLGIEQISNRFSWEISAGEEKRVGFAMALANDPPLLLFDEPTSFLDPENVKKIISLLRELHEEGKTLIIATHDERLREVGTREVRIMGGEIVYEKEL